MSVVQEVGERIVRFRAQAGLTPEAAATTAGMSVERLLAAEAGELALRDAEIEALAGALGVDATELFGGRVTPVRDYAGGA